MGDMAATITTLIMGNPGIDFVYRHIIDGREFTLDTRGLKEELGENGLQDALLIHHLAQNIRGRLKQLTTKNGESEAREKNHGKTDD